MKRRIMATIGSVIALTLWVEGAAVAVQPSQPASWPTVEVLSLAAVNGYPPDFLTDDEALDPNRIFAHAEKTGRYYRSSASDPNPDPTLPKPSNINNDLGLDRHFLEECRRRADKLGDQTQSEAGWIRNHYDWCQAMEIRISHDGSKARARLIRIGQSSESSRKTRIYFMIDQVSGSERLLGYDFRFHTNCTPAADTAGTCNVDSKGSPTMTLRDWEREGGGTGAEPPVYHEIESVVPARAPGDRVAQNRVKNQITMIGSGTQDAIGGVPVRCDSTKVETDPEIGGTDACVFNDVIPYHAYSAREGSLHIAVADHIERAFEKPDTTLPFVEGKTVPGKFQSKTYLSRTRDSEIRRLNRAEAVKTCRAYDPDYPDDGNSCDEYPFATTYEGASRGLYSAWPLDAIQNSSAGGKLGAFYKKDRILDGDKFQVKIER
ncbi:deoxyribonuclease NucA/NucB [Herbihabitans rhizosphaerae]|uniref:Deoxyribonuclease NucA/NucB n=1 Tax=Herbihabitans rhizosphaerae TaxID=1872711 RepID=A0A4Q7KLB4_9PSEU|nr:NucA/NucB deoxyribonuclease domain-containing protein [Herbihabitans rhizosphaerae]RZS37036.1 deoxyribonuclease NucA/NucB [Herbihabitans rhizosphaerae]